KAYRLLAKSMEDEKRAGIATFVMRGKEYLVAIISERGILRAETLRFHDEVRTPEIVRLPERKKAAKDSVLRMQKAMQALAAKPLDRDDLTDRYSKRGLHTVQRELRAGKGVVKAPEEVGAACAEEDNVIDLMQGLKERLQGRRPPAAERPKQEEHDTSKRH